MAITAANKIINDKYVKCDYYLIEKGNLLLHKVIVINLSDECPISDSSRLFLLARDGKFMS